MQPPRREDLVAGPPGQAAVLERAALDPAIRRDRDEVTAGPAVTVRQTRHRHAVAEAHRQPARDRAVGDDRSQPGRAGGVEVARGLRPDVRQQRDVAAAAGGELGEQRRQGRERRCVDDPVGAPALARAGEGLGRRAPVDAVVDRHADLAEPAGEPRPRRGADQRAVRGDVLRERGGRVELGDQLGEPAERERLAAAVGDLQGAGVVQAAQHRRCVRDRPGAGARGVARAELAGEVARVGDAEHRDPGRAAAQPGRRRALDPDVDAGARLEVQHGAVERVLAKRLAIGCGHG
jgi:hypothetical protein